MKRPLLSRILPITLKQSAYWRLYHKRHLDFRPLFDEAPLAHCPEMKMYNLVPGDIISGNIAFNGFYELALSNRIVELAKLGGTMIDVGANMGYFSLLWTGVKKSNQVVTFEASPRNIALLSNNFAKNKVSPRALQISKAAGNTNGSITFDVGPDDQTGWGGVATEKTTSSFDFPVVRIDDELPDIQVDVLKIDVEGADTWVLYGCEKLLRQRKIKNIFFEQNVDRMSRLGISPGAAMRFLGEFGYECEPFGSVADEWFAYPKTGSGSQGKPIK